jgi:hypothetical protein
MSADATEPFGRDADLRRKLENLNYDCSAGLPAALEKFSTDHRLASAAEAWRVLTERSGSTFSEVFQFELNALDGNPGEHAPADLAEVNLRAHRSQLSGLALSGGGIRSATFNLGVLQALAEMKLLRDFDYLSTVSGGGYIGGWLSKWISECSGNVDAVEEKLVAAKEAPCPRSEPWPVQFLRRYSNYLTPKTGFFSADTWTLICTYCRNTLLNMATLFAWLAVVFLLPRFVLRGLEATPGNAGWIWATCAVVLFLCAVFSIALSISRKGKQPWRGIMAQTQKAVLYTVCIPLIAAGFAGSVAIWHYRVPLAQFWSDLPQSIFNLPYLLAPGILYFIAWALGWTTAQILNRRSHQRLNLTAFLREAATEGLGHLLCAGVALAVGTVLLLKGVSLIVASNNAVFNSVQLATFGMPLMLTLFGISITLMIGLVGRMYKDESREWWARQGGWTVICAFFWLGLFGCTFYLPPMLDWAWKNWVATTTIGTVGTGIAMLLGLKSGSGSSTGKESTSKWKELVAEAAPYAFTLLTIALLTTVLQWLVAPALAPPKMASDALQTYVNAYEYSNAQTAQQSLPAMAPLPPPAPLIGLGSLFCWSVGVALLLTWRVDVNIFSLYMMYRLRLVRAYFGASTQRRSPHPFTGFDPDDDRSLASFLMQTAEGGGPTTQLQRPFHLINAAVNMVGGKELAWQTRKAGNFCFSPAFCGFELPPMVNDGTRQRAPRGAFRRTFDYASRTGIFKDDDAGVKLGMAVAVSGAAASSNMGYHSSPPLSFLMTLFNLRLGRWSPNPVREKAWKKAAPNFGMFSILSELLGLTDTKADFLYLSDGGHFENLGIYELVRRRCRLIIVVDASCDRQQTFDDLGNAVRKCLTDFNVPIELDAGRIKSLSATTPQGVSYATGRVKYSQSDGDAAPDGVLLYIKPVMIGGENADVLNYSKMHAEFPHESTADQWFDENQFESYRILGYRAARSALRELVASLDDGTGSDLPPQQLRRRRIERLCRLLVQRNKLRSHKAARLKPRRRGARVRPATV